ncbi:50S ribosomal protein L17 [Marinilabiliaceae bacterium JC017]|nr:50S ribosomal protein L17 [Marinilabiliaceae bacterium JC017]
MRHRKKLNHLGRTASHRKAMLANMATSLIMHKRIRTTVAKAKALRMYVEPIISKTKNLSTVGEKTHAQRLVFKDLQNKEAVKELFGEVAEKVATRPGGYTRILKLGNRLGDAAEMCYIELVDYNENMLSATKPADEAKKTRRSRRRKSSENVATTEVASSGAKSDDIATDNKADNPESETKE